MPKSLVFSDFYEQMVSSKIAYETSTVTMSRIKTIWEKSLSPFWKDIEPKSIDQRLITKFIIWHKEHRKGIQLVNVFKYLGNVFNVMVESGALDAARKPKLELPKDEQKHHATQKGRYITDAEFRSILSKSEGWFKLFLLIAYTTGMRKMEIGKLSTDRLQKIGDRYMAVLGTSDTKTGNARKIPFPAYLSPLFDKQLALGADFVFPMSTDKKRYVNPQAIDALWKKAKIEAGIVGRMREHDLRHTAASNMAKSGISPIVTVTILGMSLAMFQKTYLKLAPEDLFVATDSSKDRIGEI